MAPAGCVHNDDARRLAGQVEERVWDTRWEVRKPTGVERELIVADPHLEAAGQDVNRLLLPVMNMERRTAVGATSTTK